MTGSDQSDSEHDDDGNLWIPDDAVLLRLIHPIHVRVSELGNQVPKSVAFANTSGTDEMSVFVKKRFEEVGHRARDLPSILQQPTHGVVGFHARIVRALNQQVVPEELPQGPPGHANVIGVKDKRQKAKFHRPLIETCWWELEVPL
jgi:hypothetical protein